MTRRIARKILRNPHRYTGRQVITAAARVRPNWWPPPPGMWCDAFDLVEKAEFLAVQAEAQDSKALSKYERRARGFHDRAMRTAYKAGTAKDPQDVPF